MEATRELGNSGLKVSVVGMGVMTWGKPRGLANLQPAQRAYGAADSPAEEQLAFETALQAGVNFFDTAAMYSLGASEKRLGELARGTPALIASKFPGSLFFRVENFPRELDASLERLGRPCIDLYQHHFPARSISIPCLMDKLADAIDQGKIRAVGVSNYSASQMREAHAALARRGIPLASNQVQYSLLHRQPEVDGVLDACRELGVTLIAYMPMASGALTGKYTNSSPRPRGMRRFMPIFRKDNIEALTPLVALLTEIGQRYQKSPGQVAVRWLVDSGPVVPIPGAKNSRQATSNSALINFSLSTDEIKAIDQASQAWRRMGG